MEKFKKNIDLTGRLWRGTLTVILWVIAWTYASWVAFFLGLFTLYEALASWCVIYQLLGKNSCPMEINRK